MKFPFSSQDMLVWTFQMTFPNHRRLTDIRISRAIIEGVIVMPQFNAVDRSTSMYTVRSKRTGTSTVFRYSRSSNGTVEYPHYSPHSCQ